MGFAAWFVNSSVPLKTKLFRCDESEELNNNNNSIQNLKSVFERDRLQGLRRAERSDPRHVLILSSSYCPLAGGGRMNARRNTSVPASVKLLSRQIG